MAETKKQKDAAARKRSEAAKKAAATRKANEAKEQEQASSESQESGVEPYQPRRVPLQAAGLDQHAEEAKRTAERDAEREEHNRRTGDVSRTGRKVG